jgi:CysZ protein
MSTADSTRTASTAGAYQSLAQATGGVGLPLEGLRMVFRERSLWALAAVPCSLSFLAVISAGVLVFWNAAELYQLVAGWLPSVHAAAWYSWLWVGPAQAGLWLAGYLLFALAAGASLVLAMLVATLVSSPFQDALSEKVEHLVRGDLASDEAVSLSAIFSGGWRSFAAEIQRLLFFLGVWAVLFGVGVLIPGAQLLTSPLLIGFTVLFLPLQYAGFSLDRRRVPFAARRKWVFAHLPGMLGFGGAAFGTLLVPGLNFLMLPALVVAGTLLVLRQEPPSSS